MRFLGGSPRRVGKDVRSDQVAPMHHELTRLQVVVEVIVQREWEVEYHDGERRQGQQ